MGGTVSPLPTGFIYRDRRSFSPLIAQIDVAAAWKTDVTPLVAEIGYGWHLRLPLLPEMRLFDLRRTTTTPSASAGTALGALQAASAANRIAEIELDKVGIESGALVQWRVEGQSGFHSARIDKLPQGVRDTLTAAELAKAALLPMLPNSRLITPGLVGPRTPLVPPDPPPAR
jgi:hypothetical protein